MIKRHTLKFLSPPCVNFLYNIIHWSRKNEGWYLKKRLLTEKNVQAAIAAFAKAIENESE